MTGGRPPAITLDPAAVQFEPANGLVPAVVQDVADRRVLMLAWMDAEALAATLRTGEVHFHSRSRNRLWRKGETSGNVLRLRDIALDCDADAILLQVEPTGPACHRGFRSCFDADESALADPPASRTLADTDQGFAWLEALWTTIADRAQDRPDGSYTARLLDGGVDAVARKVAEEATELVLAAKNDAAAAAAAQGRSAQRADVAGEAADLLFHTLVLLAERGLSPSDVLAVLRGRSRP